MKALALMLLALYSKNLFNQTIEGFLGYFEAILLKRSSC